MYPVRVTFRSRWIGIAPVTAVLLAPACGRIAYDGPSRVDAAVDAGVPDDAGRDAFTPESPDAASLDTGMPEPSPVDGSTAIDGAPGPSDGGEGIPPADACIECGCASDVDCNDGDPCNGTEACNTTIGACVTTMALATGTACDSDGTGATREVCVSTVCSVSRCGDGYADVGAGEQCDDANTVSGDGCEECTVVPTTMDAGTTTEGRACGPSTCPTSERCCNRFCGICSRGGLCPMIDCV